MTLRRVCVFFVAVLLHCHNAAGQAVPFVRLSTARTPTVVDPDVLRQQTVDIPSPMLLSDPQRSAVLQLDLFADVSFRAVRERLEPTLYGMSWVGTLEGYPGSTAVFVQVDDEVVGHLYTPFGFFRLDRERSGTYLVQQVAPTTRQESDAVIPPRDEIASAPAAAPIAGADDGSIIDVLVAYTRDALNGFGSESRARAVIDQAIAETTEALRNTGLSTRVRLVRTVMVDYAETGDSTQDLTRLRVSNDGYLDSLHTLRDQYAADLVAVITERTETNFCGRGY